ncbi:hypothetical protein EJ06DRAFT_583508 [Trichodelitschia bisporula]|uniref:Ataxin-10 homolog n=1 Tax=Trichodelitschia bisporula TaxID=703511 RepID=A0A6G1HSK6_9PEZI|nr:hypothetical protein EJ06DRAFT_583508 [Trichodelitschia bisporula]
MVDSATPPPRKGKLHATLLRLGVAPLIVHFKSTGFMSPIALDAYDGRILKRTLQDSARQVIVREELGSDELLWKELAELFEAAVPSLTDRCFYASKPTDSADYENASSMRIVSNYTSLIKDIGRLNDLVAIARNALTIGDVAQNLAAKECFDQAIFKLITLCIKVTARGFDSNGSPADEEKWQFVINDYKKLLIVCLQFLNNLVAQNERRKLMLWVELFDSSADGGLNENLSQKFAPEVAHALSPQPPREEVKQPQLPRRIPMDMDLAASPFLLYIGKVGMDIKKELQDQGKPNGATEIAAECKKRWEQMPPDEQKHWQNHYGELLTRYPDDVCGPKPVRDKANESVAALARTVEQLQADIRSLRLSVSGRSLGDSDMIGAGANDTTRIGDNIRIGESISVADNPPKSPAAVDSAPAGTDDYRVTYSAEYGTAILQQGKEDLLKRLEPDSERPTPQNGSDRHADEDASPEDGSAPPVQTDDGGDQHSEEDESDDDYAVPGDDGRGLLTDVPLILGPTEIEVLPMIIQSGIVAPTTIQPGHGSSKQEIAAIKNMHTVRCHLLLAQDNGRNLLRELLIFVAAWDLREDELYFRIMVKIMEAVLLNGLMPYSYHAFKESKDIISPAQAVIMKLLTSIFRARQSEKAVQPADGDKSQTEQAVYPQKEDVQMVSFLFTEFRREIIPQTCALIFLQGQIRNGTASPDEFPLNLWDMERMYEGIYQYLEFFAILTEHDKWKQMMATWEITSELVTLLEELDVAIPRSTARTQLPNRRPQNQPAPSYAPPASEQAAPASQQPIAVERPYDINSPNQGDVSPPVQPDAPQPPYATQAEDEPSDFEWRNLKKLAVLVLSSLVWKSRVVQDQLGAPDSQGRPGRGIRALLNCCKVDDYNPYIKEHAIMALRFALEGHVENQAVVSNLSRMPVDEEGRAVDVPNEVLDINGYETYVDGKGQVQLRRRDAPRRAGAGTVARAAVTEGGVRENLMEYMQNAMGGKTHEERESAAELMKKALDSFK